MDHDVDLGDPDEIKKKHRMLKKASSKARGSEAPGLSADLSAVALAEEEALAKVETYSCT